MARAHTAVEGLLIAGAYTRELFRGALEGLGQVGDLTGGGVSGFGTVFRFTTLTATAVSLMASPDATVFGQPTTVNR